MVVPLLQPRRLVSRRSASQSRILIAKLSPSPLPPSKRWLSSCTFWVAVSRDIDGRYLAYILLYFVRGLSEVEGLGGLARMVEQDEHNDSLSRAYII